MVVDIFRMNRIIPHELVRSAQHNTNVFTENSFNWLITLNHEGIKTNLERPILMKIYEISYIFIHIPTKIRYI